MLDADLTRLLMIGEGRFCIRCAVAERLRQQVDRYTEDLLYIHHHIRNSRYDWYKTKIAIHAHRAAVVSVPDT